MSTPRRRQRRPDVAPALPHRTASSRKWVPSPEVPGPVAVTTGNARESSRERVTPSSQRRDDLMEPNTGQLSTVKVSLPDAAADSAKHCRTCGAEMGEKDASGWCGRCARANFGDAFGHALPVFLSNLAAWIHGVTDRQTRTLRRLCDANHVTFDPLHYTRLSTGAIGGWIGGPDRARPRSEGGTFYVAVDESGAAIGMGGSAVPVPGLEGDGKSTPGAVRWIPRVITVIGLLGARWRRSGATLS